MAPPSIRLARIEPPPRLTALIVERLTSAIEGQEFAVGARLPSESELMSSFGVSRTVVREAIAGLRAAGLVMTRQGQGAFVTDRPSPRAFRVLPVDMESLEAVLQIRAVRETIEIETVCLAAGRATPEEIAAILSAAQAFETSVAAGDPGHEADRRFHIAIAAASGNPYFVSVLEWLGGLGRPRSAEISPDPTPSTSWRRNAGEVADEHRRIVQTIAAHDVAAARKAIRAHFRGSRRRIMAAASLSKLTGKQEEAAPALQRVRGSRK